MHTEINGITIEVVKKNIKNMHLYVRPPDGRVQVSAPKHLTDEAVLMFVRSKIGWIKKQQLKFENQPRQSQRQYVSGESFYVLGKQYYLQVEYSYKCNSLVLSGEKAILTVRKESTPKQREAYVREWYREILKAEIEKYLPEWEKKTGLYCNEWQTKYMVTRWGTCNANTGKLWFNLQLAKKTRECIEYIILHELAHLKVKNHGVEFVAIMDYYMPYWREIKRKLNEQILDYFETV
ncbi:MAG: M48 family metallopeptidase [Clostridia bacterium]|nr:M48 family metallopeptidase [Clostridia bacterium]